MMSDRSASAAAAATSFTPDEPGEYRGPLPRLTTRVFRDLAIWMSGLGLIVGVLFPFFVVALGVPTRYALTTRFFVATTVAGLIVGAANQYLSRSVVGSRLRFMSGKMATVEALLHESASDDAGNACTAESCEIRVDSDDELGTVLTSFNRLVMAQAASHRANDLASQFASVLSSHIEVVPLLDEALAYFQRSLAIKASAVCIDNDGALATIASREIVDPVSLGESELVGRAFRTLEVLDVNLADDVLLDGGIVTFRPKQVLVLPLDIGLDPIGVLLLASAERIATEDRRMIERLIPGLSVALNNALSHERLQQVAAIDEMTGLSNRRSGLERLRQALKTSEQEQQPLGVVLFDIDRFKSVNDTYGHQIGDEVIHAVAVSATSSLRDGDTLMRYGGEEFLAILPGAGNATVREVAERIRRVVESTTISVDQSEIRVTISLGAVTLDAEASTRLDDVIRQADAAMYESKKSGRNKLTVSSG